MLLSLNAKALQQWSKKSRASDLTRYCLFRKPRELFSYQFAETQSITQSCGSKQLHKKRFEHAANQIPGLWKPQDFFDRPNW
jgi:hypothetical protein